MTYIFISNDYSHSLLFWKIHPWSLPAPSSTQLSSITRLKCLFSKSSLKNILFSVLIESCPWILGLNFLPEIGFSLDPLTVGSTSVSCHLHGDYILSLSSFDSSFSVWILNVSVSKLCPCHYALLMPGPWAIWLHFYGLKHSSRPLRSAPC